MGSSSEPENHVVFLFSKRQVLFFQNNEQHIWGYEYVNVSCDLNIIARDVTDVHLYAIHTPRLPQMLQVLLLTSSWKLF